MNNDARAQLSDLVNQWNTLNDVLVDARAAMRKVNARKAALTEKLLALIDRLSITEVELGGRLIRLRQSSTLTTSARGC
jgi:predicted  nucleic acid-binding Zn-ribbon protein